MKKLNKLLLASSTSLLLAGLLTACGGGASSSSVASSKEEDKTSEVVSSSEAASSKEEESSKAEESSKEESKEEESSEVEVTLSSIEVTVAPSKTIYFVGETFSGEGMEVTATYSDGSTKVITDFTIDKTEALTLEDKEITVSYEGKTAKVAITVNYFAKEYNCSPSEENGVYTFTSKPGKWAAFKIAPQYALSDLRTSVISFSVKTDSILNNTLYFATIIDDENKVSNDYKIGEPNAFIRSKSAEDGWTDLDFYFGSFMKDSFAKDGSLAFKYLRVGWVDENYKAENDMVEGIVSIKNMNVEASLAAPVVTLNESVISWGTVEGADVYDVYENETVVSSGAELSYTITQEAEGFYLYRVVARSTAGNIHESAFSNSIELSIGDPDDGTNVEKPIADTNWNCVHTDEEGKANTYEGEKSDRGLMVTYTTPGNSYFGGAETKITNPETGIAYYDLALVNYADHEVKVAALIRDADKKVLNTAEGTSVLHGDTSKFERVSSGSGAYIYVGPKSTAVFRLAVTGDAASIRLAIDCTWGDEEVRSGKLLIKGLGYGVTEGGGGGGETTDADDGTNVENPVANLSWSATHTDDEGKANTYTGEATDKGYKLTYTTPGNSYYGGAQVSLSETGLTGATYYDLALVNYGEHDVKLTALFRDADKANVIVEEGSSVLHGTTSKIDRFSSGSGAYLVVGTKSTAVFRLAVSADAASLKMNIDCVWGDETVRTGEMLIKGLGTDAKGATPTEDTADDGTTVETPVGNPGWYATHTSEEGKANTYEGASSDAGYTVTYTTPGNSGYGGAEAKFANLTLSGATYYDLALVNYSDHEVKMTALMRDADKKVLNTAEGTSVLHGETSKFERVSSGSGAYLRVGANSTAVFRIAVTGDASMIRLNIDCVWGSEDTNTYTGKMLIKTLGSDATVAE